MELKMSNEEVEHYTKKDLVYVAIFILSLLAMWLITTIFNNFRTGTWDMTSIYPNLTPEVMTFYGLFFLSPLFFLAIYYFAVSVKEGLLFMISVARGSQA